MSLVILKNVIFIALLSKYVLIETVLRFKVELFYHDNVKLIAYRVLDSHWIGLV